MSARPSPARRLLPGLLALAALSLGACAPAAADMTPVTVTVYPTAEPTSEEPTPIPTVYVGSGATVASQTTTDSSSAGHLRGAPADFAEAADRVEAASVATAVQGFFISPTGNIFCDVVEDGSVMACELSEGRVEAPGACPADGPQRVRRLELRSDAVTAACSGTIRTDGAPKLRYDRRTIVAGTPVQCLSEKVGVTCIDTAGRRGFFLAKGTFATF